MKEETMTDLWSLRGLSWRDLAIMRIPGDGDQRSEVMAITIPK
jgi:hypothetical protein